MYQAFSEELPHESPASRAQRRADRQLSLPAGRAHEQQVDHVDARREQDQADEHQEQAGDVRHRPRVVGLGSRQRLGDQPHADGLVRVRILLFELTCDHVDAGLRAIEIHRRWQAGEHPHRVIVATLDGVLVFRFRKHHADRQVGVELQQRDCRRRWKKAEPRSFQASPGGAQVHLPMDVRRRTADRRLSSYLQVATAGERPVRRFGETLELGRPGNVDDVDLRSVLVQAGELRVPRRTDRLCRFPGHP